MSIYRVPVQIIPRKGLLDPQGTAVASSLKTLGFDGVEEVHVGRYIVITTKAGSAAEAEASVKSMCEKLLANPVTEDFVVDTAVADGVAAQGAASE